MLLKDRSAMVTGGSRGIGAAIVRRLLAEGASVWYLSRSQSPDHAELQQAAGAAGASVAHVHVDVGDAAATEEATKGVLEQAGGHLDILVNNAGITRDNLLFRMSVDQWDEVLAVNLRSAFVTSKLVLRSMAKARSGSVVNITSIVAQAGNPGQANYCASKAGLIGLTKSSAREVAARGVRVNAIAPGFIDTEMTQSLTEDQKEAIRNQIPMARIGLPEDVASTVVYLVSDLSSYVSGQVIQVAGGLGM